MTLPRFTGFRPTALTFLRGLKRNNTKPWFEAHRETYETDVKAPLALLIEEVDAQLGVVAPEIIGNPKRSAFRIYRDVRFSKDKSPYKTHAACWFFHRDAGHGVGGQAAHGGAGFYFHLEPGQSMLGGGIWMPPGPTLKRIREVLAEDYVAFRKILAAPAFRKAFGGLSEEDAKLTRVPHGFEKDHPASEWLVYKSFTIGQTLSDMDVLSPQLPKMLVKQFAVMLPLVRWLNSAVGLRPQSRR